MKLYPKDDEITRFSDPDHAFVPLDSEAAAKARVLAKLEGECSRAAAVAAGLKGSDDVGAVEAIVDVVLAEQAKLLGLDRTDKDYATKVAAECVDLDPAKWLIARPAKAAIVLPEADLNLPK